MNSIAGGQESGGVRLQLEELLLRHQHLKRYTESLEEALAKTRSLVSRDEVTSLPNRRLLLEHFSRAAARAARQHKQVALLFLDLGDAKNGGDGLPHTTGDTLLRQVGARLAACIRASDTACRLGANQFVILLPELERQQNAVVAAEKIRAQLAASYVVDGVAVELTVSIGMATYPIDAQELGDLMRRAEVAMRVDKLRLSDTAGQKQD